MSFNLIWTPRAEKTFNNNIDYLQNDWNEQIIYNFIERVNDVLEKIQHDPDIFPKHILRKGVYRCVITQQIVLYYKVVNRTTIKLMIFWNVYQNPKKLKI